MEEQFYKCILNTDVILSKSLVTEGNLETLDYIPGSNFLGMLASKIYNENFDNELKYEIFHSGKVKFGDATITVNSGISYPFPFSYFTDKLKNKLDEDPIYLHHLVIDNEPKVEGKKLQLKQVRGGYFNNEGKFVNETKKNFSLKSAQDRKTRTSKDGQMFGYESLEAGQEFVFSIQFENPEIRQILEKYLEGSQRLGKSKTAEFGQVEIKKVDNLIKTETFESEGFVLVYAQSNLCFFDENGQPTFQPKPEDFGIKGQIIWKKSQIRTHSYSPWNFKRHANNTQRFCISKGSVLYIETNEVVTENFKSVGHYQSEGLGKIIFNPAFLNSKGDNQSVMSFQKIENSNNNIGTEKKEPLTKLGIFLKKQSVVKDTQKSISQKIVDLIKDEKYKSLKNISPSQWGGIRALATHAKDMNNLEEALFDSKIGLLTHGVSYEKQWGVNRDKNLKLLKEIFKENLKLGTEFIAKFAAEMAKEKKDKDNYEKN